MNLPGNLLGSHLSLCVGDIQAKGYPDEDVKIFLRLGFKRTFKWIQLLSVDFYHSNRISCPWFVLHLNFKLR